MANDDQLLESIGVMVNSGQNIANQASIDARNKDSREWAEHMYQVERRDALADYEMTRTYNSPAEQMKRLVAAGLNPNLVYGTGAATQAAAPPRGTQAGGYNPEAAKVDMAGMWAGIDATVKQAQAENLRANTKVALENAILTHLNQDIAVGTAKKQGVDTERAELELQNARTMTPGVIEQLGLQNKKLAAETENIGTQEDIAINQDIRAALLNAQTLQKGLEEIANLKIDRMVKAQGIEASRAGVEKIKAEVENIRKSGILLDFDRKLRERDINPGDPGYIRAIEKLLIPLYKKGDWYDRLSAGSDVIWSILVPGGLKK